MNEKYTTQRYIIEQELFLANRYGPVLQNCNNSIPVPPQKLYHGFDYTQVCRGARSCLYQQTLHGKTIAFEVFKISIQPETIINGVVYPARERWPKNEDFGKTAWSYLTFDKAKTHFEKIERVLSNNTTKGT